MNPFGSFGTFVLDHILREEPNSADITVDNYYWGIGTPPRSKADYQALIEKLTMELHLDLSAGEGALRSARYGTGAEIEVHVVNGWLAKHRIPERVRQIEALLRQYAATHGEEYKPPCRGCGEFPVPLPYLVPNEPRTTVRQLLPQGGGKCCHSPSSPPQQKVKNAAAAPTGAGDVAAGNGEANVERGPGVRFHRQVYIVIYDQQVSPEDLWRTDLPRMVKDTYPRNQKRDDDEEEEDDAAAAASFPSSSVNIAPAPANAASPLLKDEDLGNQRMQRQQSTDQGSECCQSDLPQPEDAQSKKREEPKGYPVGPPVYAKVINVVEVDVLRCEAFRRDVVKRRKMARCGFEKTGQDPLEDMRLAFADKVEASLIHYVERGLTSAGFRYLNPFFRLRDLGLDSKSQPAVGGCRCIDGQPPAIPIVHKHDLPAPVRNLRSTLRAAKTWLVRAFSPPHLHDRTNEKEDEH